MERKESDRTRESEERAEYCIRKVTNQQSFQLKLTHNGYGHQLMDNEEPIVWHEPILDDCWAVLNGQMRLMDSVTKVKGIDIENLEMKKEQS